MVKLDEVFRDLNLSVRGEWMFTSERKSLDLLEREHAFLDAVCSFRGRKKGQLGCDV